MRSAGDDDDCGWHDHHRRGDYDDGGGDYDDGGGNDNYGSGYHHDDVMTLGM